VETEGFLSRGDPGHVLAAAGQASIVVPRHPTSWRLRCCAAMTAGAKEVEWRESEKEKEFRGIEE